MKINLTPILLICLLITSIRGVCHAQAQTSGTTQSAANTITTYSSIATLTNSATETTLVSKVIPGGLLGASRKLTGRAVFTLSSTLVNPAITIKIKYGAMVLTAVGSLSINLSLTAQPFYIDFEINNLNSTNAQLAIARVYQSSISSPLGTTSPFIMVMQQGTTDSTADQTFSVTATFNSALTGTTLIPLLINTKIE